MTEHESFLQAIIENPADDALRLIFADWLEEHGESKRTEFIRVQCELAQYNRTRCLATKNRRAPHKLLGLPVVLQDDMCGQCRWCLLTKRERALAPKATIREYERLCELDWTQQPTFNYRRGFIAEAAFACQDWLTHREALLRVMPLEKVMLTHWGFGLYGGTPSYEPAPPFADKDYISPFISPTLRLQPRPLTLHVREGGLFDTESGRDVVVVSLVEHGVLFGRPVAVTVGRE